MARLDVDFNDVPDEIKPIDPGTYTLEVAKVPVIEPSAKGNGQNLIVDFRVVDEGAFKRRSVRDYIFLNEFGLVKAKKLIIGCGMPVGNGLDTEEMLGMKTQAILAASSYVDGSGETIHNSKISKYIQA